jgi:hypothetical protein
MWKRSEQLLGSTDYFTLLFSEISSKARDPYSLAESSFSKIPTLREISIVFHLLIYQITHF